MQQLNKQIDNWQKNAEESKSGPPNSKLDILWAFTNADKMKIELWSRLESRLLDIYKKHNGIRYLVTSNENQK